MNKELRAALAIACKDFGLTEKAIDRLAELGGEGLEDTATAEEITAKVTAITPFAKAMQAEITRKTQPAPTPAPTPTPAPPKPVEPKPAEGWLEQMQEIREALTALKRDNDNLRQQQQQQTRAEAISAKAKELGIPDFIVRRCDFAEGADIDKELGELKQELVNSSLLPDTGRETAEHADTDKAEAEEWAKSL